MKILDKALNMADRQFNEHPARVMIVSCAVGISVTFLLIRALF
jgi:hypothetical protein